MRPEQRDALHAVARRRGTTITAMVLGLIEEPVAVVAPKPEPPPVERKPLARPAEKERLSEQLARQTAGRRPFTPYSKEQQAGRKPR